MMKMISLGVICGILILFLAGSLWGADCTITSISVTPSTLKINEPYEVTVNGTITSGKTCQLCFTKGDGTPQSLAGNATSFPFKFGGQAYPLYTYSKAGTYTIKVFCCPGSSNCVGQAQATVKVRPMLKAGTVAKVFAANPCPTGWHKKSGSANSAFTCVPNMPSQKIQCPQGTEYFETECTVGCKTVIY